jgi:hypothetical protein
MLPGEQPIDLATKAPARFQLTTTLTQESTILKHFRTGDVAEWLKAAVC